MPLHILSEANWFPPVTDAMEDGLLAIGGDVTANRLLLAYQKGIFPWYNDDLPLWWSPDPRFVLFPDEFFLLIKVLKKCSCNVVFHPDRVRKVPGSILYS
jgi:Leu/Phe-tRNA-protein transferase